MPNHFLKYFYPLFLNPVAILWIVKPYILLYGGFFWSFDEVFEQRINSQNGDRE